MFPISLKSLDVSRQQRLTWLGLVVLLGAFLHFYQLGATSIGNAYYALFGSDWPVCTLSGTYAKVVQIVQEYL